MMHQRICHAGGTAGSRVMRGPAPAPPLQATQAKHVQLASRIAGCERPVVGRLVQASNLRLGVSERRGAGLDAG